MTTQLYSQWRVAMIGGKTGRSERSDLSVSERSERSDLSKTEWSERLTLKTKETQADELIFYLKSF